MKSLAIVLSLLMVIGFTAMPAFAVGPIQHGWNGHMNGYTMGHQYTSTRSNDIRGLQHQVKKKMAKIKTLKARPKPDWNRIDALTLQINKLQSRIQTKEKLQLRGLTQSDFFYGCYAERGGYVCR